jgi:hypothetical protein
LISLLVSDFKDQCGSVPSISVAVLGLGLLNDMLTEKDYTISSYQCSVQESTRAPSIDQTWKGQRIKTLCFLHFTMWHQLKPFNAILLTLSSWLELWPVQVYAQHLLAECISYCIKTFEFYSLEGFSIHSLVPFVCVQCCTTQNIRDIHKLHDKSFVNKGWM